MINVGKLKVTSFSRRDGKLQARVSITATWVLEYQVFPKSLFGCILKPMNLTATLCQTRSPVFFTFYKQNNNKNVKKAGDALDRASPLTSSPFFVTKPKKTFGL